MQTELQIKQRELLELKKRKLELELAATQKQLAITPTTVLPQPHSAMTDPTKLLNSNELTTRDPVIIPTIMPVIPKPSVVIPHSQAFIPGHMPPRSTPRIAPVNPTMVNSVRLRDPRLARQNPQTIAQGNTSQPMNDHHIPPKISTRKLQTFNAFK